MTDTIASQNIDLSSWVTLYIWCGVCVCVCVVWCVCVCGVCVCVCVCGATRHTFNTSNNETLLRLYKIRVLPTLLFGCGNWTSIKHHERRTETMEVTYWGSVAGQMLRKHKTSEEIRRQINASNLNDSTVRYRCQQTQHLFRTECLNKFRLAEET
jgi:hypothetical protein